MAVYTSLSFEESSDWFENTFDLGQVTDLVGISGGIENTNYFLTAIKDNVSTQYVLTIFERSTLCKSATASISNFRKSEYNSNNPKKPLCL